MLKLWCWDTKIFEQITFEVADGQDLQQTIAHLSCWTNTNNIKFNESKCKKLSVSCKKEPITFIHQLDSNNLNRVQKEKNLGLVISHQKPTERWDYPHYLDI